MYGTLLLSLVTALALTAPASGDRTQFAARLSSSVPFVTMSPSSGGPTTTFRLSIPARLLRRTDGSELQALAIEPANAPRSCASPFTDPPRARVGGRVVYTYRPRDYGTRGRWCRGTWRALVTAEQVVDDDETGEGGVFEDELVRSKFVVR